MPAMHFLIPTVMKPAFTRMSEMYISLIRSNPIFIGGKKYTSMQNGAYDAFSLLYLGLVTFNIPI
jgi:hypothetical protein